MAKSIRFNSKELKNQAFTSIAGRKIQHISRWKSYLLMAQSKLDFFLAIVTKSSSKESKIWAVLGSESPTQDLCRHRDRIYITTAGFWPMETSLESAWRKKTLSFQSEEPGYLRMEYFWINLPMTKGTNGLQLSKSLRNKRISIT